MYFSANNYHNSGGTLVLVQESVGGCPNKTLIYGTIKTEGGSYIQSAGADGVVHYRSYRYVYTYQYQGSQLVVEGTYTVTTEAGTTTYPVKWIWKF